MTKTECERCGGMSKAKVQIQIIIIFVISVLFSAVAASSELEPLTASEIGYLSFDDGKAYNKSETIEQFSEDGYASYIEKVQNENDTFLRINATPIAPDSDTYSYSVCQIGFDKLTADKPYYISWNFYLHSGADTVFTLSNENGVKSVFGYVWLYKEGYIRAERTWNKNRPTTENGSTKKITIEAWHNIEVVINPTAKTITYYIDGDKFSTQSYLMNGTIRHMFVQPGATQSMIENKEAAIDLDDFESGVCDSSFSGKAEINKNVVRIRFNQCPKNLNKYNMVLSTEQGESVSIAEMKAIGKKAWLTLVNDAIGGEVYAIAFSGGLISAKGERLNEISAYSLPTRFSASATPQNIGGIFSDGETIGYNLLIEKCDGISGRMTLDISARVKNKDGNILWEGTTAQTITAIRKLKTVSIYPQVFDNKYRYGVFDFEIEVKESGDDVPIVLTVPFSQIMSNDTLNYSMGVSTHYIERYKNVDNMSEQVGINSKAGIGIDRDDISWGTYEANPFHSLKGNMEKFYASARDNNIIPFGVTAHGIWKYGIGKGRDGRFPGIAKYEFPYDESAANEQFDKYKAYIKDFVKETNAYTPSGKSNIIEIGNEWDLGYYARTYTAADGTTKKFGVVPYVNILKCAYDAVADISPRPKIVGVVSAVKTKEEFLKILGEYLDAGAADYCDAVSLHPYYWKQSPEDYDICGLIDETNKLFDDKNIPRKPLILSEWGTSSALALNNNEEKQAMYAIRGMGLVGTMVDSVIWYTGQEKDYDTSVIEQKLGLVKSGADDIPCAAKPVYAALSCYNSLTSNTVQNKWMVDENGTYTCEYDSENKKVIMFWNPSGGKNISVNRQAGFNNTALYDMYGNRSVKSNLLTTYSLVAEEQPQYIVFSKSDDFISKIQILSSFETGNNKLLGFKENNGFVAVDLSSGRNSTLGKLIIAAYSDNRLVDIQQSDIKSDKSGIQRIKIPWEKPTDNVLNDIDEIKAFIWNETDGMIPLTGIETITE